MRCLNLDYSYAVIHCFKGGCSPRGRAVVAPDVDINCSLIKKLFYSVMIFEIRFNDKQIRFFKRSRERLQISCGCACLLLTGTCGIREGTIPTSQIKTTSAGAEFPFQKSLGGMSTVMMGGGWGWERATHCIPIIHFGIAVFQNGLLSRILLSALVGLHSHTLSLAGIISWLSKICASDIFSFLSERSIDSAGSSHSGSSKIKEMKITHWLFSFSPKKHLGYRVWYSVNVVVRMVD